MCLEKFWVVPLDSLKKCEQLGYDPEVNTQKWLDPECKVWKWVILQESKPQSSLNVCGCRIEIGMLNYVKDMREDFREDRRRNLSEETGKLSVNSLVLSLCKSIDKVEHNGV